MAKSSNASTSAFGWDFQRNAAIVLMLKNIKETSKIKVEGKKEDIEITLNNKKIIYSQAKSVYNQEDTSKVITKLKDALKSLNEASKETDVDSLIYTTNSPNPFNDVQTVYAFSSNTQIIEYEKLNSICKNKIDEIYNENNYTFDKKQLNICVIQFSNDLNNRYNAIIDIINNFFSKLGIGSEVNSLDILSTWQNELFKNATTKTINITKKQIIWPLVVILCDINRDDAEVTDLDDSIYNEIERKYKAIICNNSENFSFIIKVINSYQDFLNNNKLNRNNDKIFIKNNWHLYKDEINMPYSSPEVIEGVTRLTLSSILKRRHRINEIKTKVNL